MEKELGPDVLKATQTALRKYVKRPPLTDKLLRKPPFRFLHDIITTVLKTTGFFNGLFEDDELISENVKDRDSKINFLQKVITVLNSTTGKSISAKPSKIVAGQEPEKTNELLQILAYALDKKLSSDDAVKKLKENSKVPNETKSKEPVSSTKKNNDAKKLTSKSSEKLTVNKKDSTKVEKNKTNDSKSKKKDTEVSKNESQVKKSSKSVKKTTSENRVQSTASLQKDAETNSNKDSNEQIVSKPEIEDKSPKKSAAITEVLNTRVEQVESKIEATDEIKLNSSYTIIDNDTNSLSSQDNIMGESYKHEEDRNDNQSEVNETEITAESLEERNIEQKTDISDSLPSNNKSTPVALSKIGNSDSVDKSIESIKNTEYSSSNLSNKPNVEIVRPPSVRPSSSRPGAPRLREKTDSVIADDNLLLAKVNIIAENSQNEEEEESSVIIVGHNSDSETAEETDFQQTSNEHGHLVQQILDSQKEYSQAAGKTEIEWQLGAHKAIDTANQEIEQLRFNIQAMSRVANPLGKLLDHIQEDVEMMRQELQQWTNIYEEVSADMVKQKTASEETLVPLQSRIKQLNMDIVEKQDKINDLKVLVHKNSSRIEKLLANGNVQ